MACNGKGAYTYSACCTTINFSTNFRIYFTLQLNIIRLCDSILKLFLILFFVRMKVSSFDWLTGL